MKGVTDITNLSTMLPVSTILQSTSRFRSRVIADGGTISDLGLTNDAFKELPQQDSILLCYLGVAGRKLRTSTVWSFFTKWYDMFWEYLYDTAFVDDDASADNTGDWSVNDCTLVFDTDHYNIVYAALTQYISRTFSALPAGKWVKLSCKVKDGTASGIDGRIFCYVSVTASAGVGKQFTTTSEWQEVSTIVSVGTGYDTFGVKGTLTSGNFQVKDLKIEQVLNQPFDATQTTDALQPYLTGNIAPNENEGLKNVNGDSRYMTHPAISFASNEAWSFTAMLNWDGNERSSAEVIGSSVANKSVIFIKVSYFHKFAFRNQTGTLRVAGSETTQQLLGKYNICTFIANGDGFIHIYINGISSVTITNPTDFTFENFICAGSINPVVVFNGILSACIIRNIALQPADILTEAQLLQKYYPEIPSVVIGTQTWATSNFEAVATPMGTVIPEMQDAVAVETYASNFESNADSFLTIRATVDGNIDGILGVDNVLRAYASSDVAKTHYIYRGSTFTSGVKYQISFDYYIPSANTNVNGIGCGYSVGGYVELKGGFDTVGSWQSVSFFGIPLAVYLQFRMYKDGNHLFTGAGVVTDDLIYIKNVVLKQLGWADSQDLYDGLIAQGESVYDATKAAAMWCYYNNDMPTGAVYGKLYNWFAAKLLQTDIDTYNASNPDWGWHVPTEAEEETLTNYLGDDSAYNEKLNDTTYWIAPNDGTNSSGLSLLPSGVRRINGEFEELTESAYFWNDGDVTDAQKRQGMALRLKKD